jgi:hypothetical protein
VGTGNHRANGAEWRSGRKPDRARVLIPLGYLHQGKGKHLAKCEVQQTSRASGLLSKGGPRSDLKNGGLSWK